MKFGLSAALFGLNVTLFAAPVIDPISNKNIPAGKSLIIPVTATSTNGRPLTFTATSSTNRITVRVHTNNPFWKMSIVQAANSNAPGAFLTGFRGGLAMVTNVGDLTFMLFKELAPRTVDAISGLTLGAFYNSNTIIHRVVATPFAIIQGGDPNTNGSGGPVFRFDDELNPQAIFSGNGQLAMANSGPDSAGSQFFVTVGPQRVFDCRYTVFGQLLRGFGVLTNILGVATNSANRPLADVIIARASLVPNWTDTVLTLTGTNLAGISGTIRVIADDGTAGGRVTNMFTATTVSDGGNNAPPFLYPKTVTNLLGPLNGRLTNIVSAVDLEGQAYYWFPYLADYNSYLVASNSTFGVTNGQLRVVLVPATNYAGPVFADFFVSADPNWSFYYENYPPDFWPPYDSQSYRFAIGETQIISWSSNLVSNPLLAYTNQLLVTFSNGVANSAASNFNAFINWGDNVITSGSILTNTGGRKEVRGSHTYTNSGHYPVYVTINSYIGAQARTSLLAVVPPALSLSRSGTNSILKWPAWASEYQPQTHTNLGTTNWVALTNLPALAGYEIAVTNGSTASNALFRLRR